MVLSSYLATFILYFVPSSSSLPVVSLLVPVTVHLSISAALPFPAEVPSELCELKTTACVCPMFWRLLRPFPVEMYPLVRRF